jgi:acetolactate synthase-1/2/3 large subunit
MNAAEALVRTALDLGLDTIFANPGTTEMPIVNALDRIGGMKGVLGLQENVVTGAADGFARMAGKPALTLLHLGPGFANGIANLHNARRARTSIVNLVGEHATWHKSPEAPLASDIESLARPVSGWVGRATSGAAVPRDLATAKAEAERGAGRVTTLVLPHDLQLAEGVDPVTAAANIGREPLSDEAVDSAARVLGGEKALLFLGNDALSERGLKAAARIAAASGADLMSQGSNARAERGQGLPAFARLPYLPEKALAALAPYRTVILAGALSPVAFFGWPGYPSSLMPEGTNVVTLAGPDGQIVAALEALADALGAATYEASSLPVPPALSEGRLTAESLTATLAALQPEGCILVNESITTGWNYHAQAMGAPRFTELQITGGAIGCGPSLSLGAAIADPGRQVVTLQADGSALYNPQALWSQAREGARIVTVICSNRRYQILRMEMERAGLNRPGDVADSMTDLARPAVDWPAVARGFGVAAERAETTEEFARAFERGIGESGPYLIEAMIG